MISLSCLIVSHLLLAYFIYSDYKKSGGNFELKTPLFSISGKSRYFILLSIVFITPFAVINAVMIKYMTTDSINYIFGWLIILGSLNTVSNRAENVKFNELIAVSLLKTIIVIFYTVDFDYIKLIKVLG